MEKFYLDSIAGYETEKQELAKIIDIFARYDEYGERGARLPKGLTSTAKEARASRKGSSFRANPA